MFIQPLLDKDQGSPSTVTPSRRPRRWWPRPRRRRRRLGRLVAGNCLFAGCSRIPTSLSFHRDDTALAAPQHPLHREANSPYRRPPRRHRLQAWLDVGAREVNSTLLSRAVQPHALRQWIATASGPGPKSATKGGEKETPRPAARPSATASERQVGTKPASVTTVTVVRL